jgi:DNA-binding protein Fis
MSPRTSPVHVLLLTPDPQVQADYSEVFREATIVAAKDLAAVPKEALKRSFDAVIVETHRQGHHGDWAKLVPGIDPARTLIVAGSRPVLKRTSALLQARRPRSTVPANGPGPAPGLETYLEHKVEDFVRGMRNGSARNLHPMLISAVERPLIALALQETKGNQIQAAELLGLNRNTLRRKIQTLRIPVKRPRTHS